MIKTKMISIIFWVLSLVVTFSSGWASQPQVTDYTALDQSIMRPGLDTLLGWQKEAKRAPKTYIDGKIQEQLIEDFLMDYATSLSLLSHLEYTPGERQQGNCGNCWNWAGVGVMEIALYVQNGIRDRLSTQLLNSCKIDRFACCGNNLLDFARWYGQVGYAIPWSNTAAAYSDANTLCNSGTSAIPCGSVAKSPNYPISSISATVVETNNVGQAAAINNIKNVLNQNKAIWFGFFLPNQSDWDQFYTFWSGAGASENTLWDPDFSCGHTWNESQGGGHAVLLVGYNDDDPNPANHYWTFLNSWGTASGKRPNGLFRMKMNIDYDCFFPTTQGNLYAYTWETLNINFNTGQQCNYSVNPQNASFTADGGNGSMDVMVADGCNWSASPSHAWITITAGGNGSGNGLVSYSVAVNTGGPRSGTITVQNRTLNIQQSGMGLSTNLLDNPGFEDGDNGVWINNGYIIFLAPCYTYGGIDCAHGGEYLAWIGGYHYANDYLYQTINIPSEATDATLAFMYAIETEDDPSLPYDVMEVLIERISDGAWRTLVSLSNQDATSEWVKSPSYNISDFLGESINVWINCSTDESLLTNFFLDDVELSATTIPPKDINVKGNARNIADGDNTPDPADHTDFGSTDIDIGSVTRTFTIENTGSGLLNLTGTPKVTLSGLHPGDFSVTVQPGSPIGPSSSTTFQIEFDPSTAGVRLALVDIASDDSDENPYDFIIQGQGSDFCVWMGNSINWNDDGNWSDGHLPNFIVDVLIPKSSTGGFFPKLNTQPNAQAKSLRIEGGGLTIESHQITIGGN